MNRAFTVVFKGRNGRGRTSRLRGPSGPGAQELPQPSGTLPGWLGQGEGPECERPVEEGWRELCTAAEHLCSWLHPCPFLGISSPWQGSPSSARETPDARASDTRNRRGHSARIRPQAGSASRLPLPSHPIPGWGGLTLSPMPFVAISLVSWEGCPRWREGDCVCWGRGGSLLWCCLPYLWPLRAPAWIPSIWHQRPPSLGGLQPCPQQCVWKAEASTPAVTSCSRVIQQGPYTVLRWWLSFPRESCGSTCFIGAAGLPQSRDLQQGSRRVL